MLPLIRKDWIACRRLLLIGLGLYFLWAVCTYGQPLAFYILNVSAIMMLTLAPIIVDDRCRIEMLTAFLPPSRSKVVLARYAIALISLLIGAAAQYGFGVILNIGVEGTGFFLLCSPQAVFAFCIAPVTLISLFYPCFFRFGLWHGSLAYAVLMIALTTLLSSPFVASSVFSVQSDFVLTREMLQQPEAALIALIDSVAAAFGGVRFYAAATLGVAVLVAGSVALSIRFFRERDL